MVTSLSVGSAKAPPRGVSHWTENLQDHISCLKDLHAPNPITVHCTDQPPPNGGMLDSSNFCTIHASAQMVLSLHMPGSTSRLNAMITLSEQTVAKSQVGSPCH